MAEKRSWRILIIVAVIGAVGTLGGALITILPDMLNDADEAKKYNLEAEIDDRDGYTLVRSMPSKNGEILDTVREGEVFHTYFQKDNWWQVKTPNNKIGFMHSSRIKLVE